MLLADGTSSTGSPMTTDAMQTIAESSTLSFGLAANPLLSGTDAAVPGRVTSRQINQLQ